MNGRFKKEQVENKKILNKISELPEIFSKFYTWLTARDKSISTIKNYINHVVEFMNFITKNKIDNEFYKNVNEDDIENFMIHIKTINVNGEIKQAGDDIRAAKWSSLNTFFKFLMQKKYIENNPMEFTERPQIKTEHMVTYLTPQEINSVLDRIENEGRPMTKNRDMCIVSLALSTGLRVSAIVNINVEDIDFNNNIIKVIEKGNKKRNVYFADHMKDTLLLWLRDRKYLFKIPKEENALFISQLKNRISVDSVEDLVKKYTNHLNKKITPHKLRSSAAMNLHGAGVDILTIAALLGHSQITTTQRYTAAYDEDKKQATNILDELI